MIGFIQALFEVLKETVDELVNELIDFLLWCWKVVVTILFLPVLIPLYLWELLSEWFSRRRV